MSKLVIVESPAKAKTIKKYLGSGYEVVASMGHIRDLPKSTLGVDIENDYQPKYIAAAGKKALIKSLKEQAELSEKVFLAADPDREGEAISWHLAQVLELDEKALNRVTFNEITKNCVLEGIKNPRNINMSLVDAQQARRVLDRIVGYKLSPFLWKKVKSGLSAGRVQSVALKLIVDREKEIRAFIPEEFWTLEAELIHQNGKFTAKLYKGKDGKKIELKNKEQCDTVIADLDGAQYTVDSIKKGVRTKQPAPPFTTSTLQQDASRKLGFTGQRTMRAAQQLYEGVEVGKLGITGLITYMRTDSLRISEDARSAGNAFIAEKYGKNYLPEKPRYYKSKSGAQDAHEAIRPTNVNITPADVKDFLTADQYKLYSLIWKRFIASLMAGCVQDTVTADVAAAGYILRTSGYTVRFDGYTAIYEEGRDEDEEGNTKLPEMKQGDALALEKLRGEQKFTQPPARYTEATLIKELEENGVGRPSTYVPIITNILQREYIEREKKSLKPTALGEIITDIMDENFKNIVDIKFTAGMEDNLDKIESGELNWVKTIDDFYKDFAAILKAAESSMDGVKVKVPDVETDVVCELCGKKMVIKNGRFGKFLACPGYPQCKNTKPIVNETAAECPLCGGKVLQKKSRNGKKYFGCEHNPKCSFMTWDDPTSEKCPNCGKSLFKKRGGVIHCLSEGCGYETAAKTRKKSVKGENK